MTTIVSNKCSNLRPRRGRPPSFDRTAALDAATRLFWRHGYKGTSVAMLAQAMATTPPTLYAAFGSKDALYGEALTHYRGLIPDESDASGYDRIVHRLRTAASSFAHPSTPLGCLVATALLHSSRDSRSAADKVAAVRTAELQVFVDAVEQDQQDGRLPAELQPIALARFYAAVLQGMSVQAADGADTAALHRIVDLALAAWPSNRG